MTQAVPHRRIPHFLAIALALLWAGSVAAQESPSLYLVDSQFEPGLQTRIFLVDTATGSLELRADLGTTYTPVLGMAAAGGMVLYLAGTDTELCQGNVACLLLRVVMDPLSPTPASVQVVGTITEDGAMRAGITGLTFRQDGNLYAISQDTSGLYLLDPVTAVLTRIGTIDIEVHGGDITFDGSDRLWLWTNNGSGTGLYLLDPVTAHASLFDLLPYVSMAGLAAVGHGDTMRSASTTDSQLYEIDPLVGLTGITHPLTLDGVPFAHKRGDLDSPFCEGNDACADSDPCTSDECAPGGCRHTAAPNGTACDDGNACTLGDSCLAGACVAGPLPDADADGYVAALCGGGDCDDGNASIYPGAAQLCDGLNNDCLSPGWPSLAGTNEADDDGDTLSECQGDCNDAVAATYPGAVEVNDALDNQCPSDYGYGSIDEISGLSGFTIPGDSTQFCWIAQFGATQYEVVRSNNVSFPKGCAGAYQPSVSWVDEAIPPLGSVFFYLVRPVSPYTGSWGNDSSGKERTGICPSGPH